jgi:hypothetical protein
MRRTEYPRGVWLLSVVMMLLIAGCEAAEAEPEVRPETEADQPARPSGFALEDLDECIEGDWVMQTSDLDILVATLVPLPGMRIPSGSLFLSIKDGVGYRYGSDGFVIHIDVGEDAYLEGLATFLATGTYLNSEPGTIVFSGDGAEKSVSEWIAYKQGQTQRSPGTGPEVTLPLTGPVAYQCSDQELVLYRTGPTGEVPMIFKRASE